MNDALFVLDVETLGPRVDQHAMIAVGWVHGDYYGRVFQKNRVCLKEGAKIPDEACLKTFWNKKPEQVEQLAIFRRDAIEPAAAMTKVLNAIKEAEKLTTALGGHMRIMSDNLAFDIAFINHYLSIYTDHPPLEKSLMREYQPTFDVWKNGDLAYGGHWYRQLHVQPRPFRGSRETSEYACR